MSKLLENKKAFTLIELLIVVAIIAILAAIAVPNFLEAQTRAKVARSAADLRTISTGLEMYHLDNNTYPKQNIGCRALAFRDGNAQTLERLSTPIAYLTGEANYYDPFDPRGQYQGPPNYNTEKTIDQATNSDYDRKNYRLYRYNAMTPVGSASFLHIKKRANPVWYAMESCGPDGHYHLLQGFLTRMKDTKQDLADSQKLMYDSTNGTVSRGSMWRAGGAPSTGRMFFQAIQTANN